MKDERIREQKTAMIKAIAQIRPADRAAKEAARQRQDSLAKPPGSLGGLEEIAVRMAGITGQVIPGADPQDVPGADPQAIPERGVKDSGAAGSAGRPGREPKRAARFPGAGCVMVFCADNGVVKQGVASAPQSVTRAQTMNFTRRLTGVGALSESFGSELLIVDMGVKEPIPAELYDQVPLRDTHKIVDRRIRPGTWDIAEGPAMTEEEALQAMAAGMEMAGAAARAGFHILGIGEMGIGNTTTSAAVLSAITGADAEKTCGRGGGVNDAGFQRKKEIVEQIRQELRAAKAEDAASEGRSGDQAAKAGDAASEGRSSGQEAEAEDTVNAALPGSQSGAADTQENNAGSSTRLDRIVRILARCGGFDLAAMTGAYLGAAAERTPVVIDGYISVVAALAAAEIEPAAADFMFASHVSAEPGYALALQRLAELSPGLSPFLSLDMRLGEGSGCPIAFEVIRGACDVMRNMATFEEAAINDDYLEEVRAGGCF